MTLPSALMFAEGPGVGITGECSFIVLEETLPGIDRKHDVFIALGSNIRDPFRAIENAIR